MKLNLDFYDVKNDKGIDEISKDIIVSYIEKIDNEKLETVLEKDDRLEVVYAISKLRGNIISWYPFNDNAEVLEIGGNFGEITGFLCEKVSNVTTIEESKIKAEAIAKRQNSNDNLEVIAGNIRNIRINKKYDYIFIHDCLVDLKDVLPYLKEDGKILACFDNTYGVDNFIIKYKNDIIKNGISKGKIEKSIKESGFKYSKFYYPFPDYKITNVIFTDDELPNDDNISRHIKLYNKNQILNNNSKEVFLGLIKNSAAEVSQFANSFLVELSMKECDNNDIKFVSFSILRKDEYRIRTTMKSDKVIKTAGSIQGREHIKRIGENLNLLNKLGIKSLDKYNGDSIESEFCIEKSLDEIIIEALKNGDNEKFYKEVENWRKELLKIPAYDLASGGKDIFDKYSIEIDLDKKRKMHFIKYGLWDLIFQNCFKINNELFFYDQEWYDDNTPIEYIIYRAFIYFPEVFKYIEKDKLFKELGILEFEKELSLLDNEVQKQIRNDEIWKLHTQAVTTEDIMKRQKDEIERLNNEIKRYQNEIKALNKDREDTIEKLHKAEMDMVFLKNSMSWKITKPLRAVRGIVKKNK